MALKKNPETPEQKARKEKPAVNRRKLRFRVYATGYSLIFVAALVCFNIIASVLAAKFPLNLDFTADKIFTISDENKDYIKKVDREVEILIVADEKTYTSGTYAEYLGYQDNTGGKYFQQAVELLREYHKINDKISFRFEDPQDPEFSAVTREYSDLKFSYGDFLVTRKTENGNRYRLLKTEDLFNTTDQSGYGYGPFVISGSKVESAVTSAIYAVSSDKTHKVAVLKGHGEGDASALESLMKEANFEFVAVENLLKNNLPEDAEIVLIAGPSSDYSGAELDKLTDFLGDREKSDKALFYVADPSKPKLPNLWEFLAEWGIRLHEGIVYETDSSYHAPNDNTEIVALLGESEFTGALSESNIDYFFYAKQNQGITPAFESKDSRSTEKVVAFRPTAVLRPADADDKWKPDTDSEEEYQLALVTTETEYEGTDPRLGYVAAFSSMDLLNAGYTQYSQVANMKVMLAVANKVVKADDTSIYIAAKTISGNSFTVSAVTANVVTIVFAALLPFGTLAAALIIWIRRKNL